MYKSSLKSMHSQMLVEIFIFSIVCDTKLKKKFAAKFSKKMDFLSLHQNAVPVFYSQKKTSDCFAKRAKIDQFAKAVKVEKSKQN